MYRRSRRTSIFHERTQDPGKDLFAYLFLLIMVFSFMLLMTTEERLNSISGQKGPERQTAAGHSKLAAVSGKKIGRLTKKDGELYLAFGREFYHPRKDLGRLEKDQRVSAITDEAGRQKKVLYLEEDRANKVLLTEYLTAFQNLSNQGISIAFAERVK